MTSSRHRLELASILTAVLVIVACTVMLLRRTPGQQSLASTLRPATGPAAGQLKGQLEAYIVLQLKDCSSGLEFASLFARPSVRRRVHFRGFLLLGTEVDIQVVRRRLAALGFHDPVRRVGQSATGALAALGHRATPFVVVLDEQGSVRLSVASPSTPQEFVHLAALLPRIALRQ